MCNIIGDIGKFVVVVVVFMVIFVGYEVIICDIVIKVGVVCIDKECEMSSGIVVFV